MMLGTIRNFFSVGIFLLSFQVIANESCPQGYDYLINDFPAKKIGYSASENENIAYIADKILQHIDAVERLLVVGHASTYGNGDFQKISEDRAEVVLDEIVARVENKLGKEVEFYIEFYGMADDCPIATNSTVSGRATNRRAQVWVQLASRKEEETENSAVKVPRLNKLLKHVAKKSNNPNTVCIADKLLDPKNNFKYLTLHGINAAMDPPIDMENLGSFKAFLFDMRDMAKKTRKRIVKVPTTDTPEKRFLRFMKGQTRQLIRGINALDSKANCYDKRVVTMRRYLIRKTKKENSLYSCPTIKKQVKAMLDSLGGTPIGCSRL